VGPTFEERIEMVLAAAAQEPRFSAGSTDGGLFIEIVRECREVYGRAAEFFIICGRDAAERAIAWDYARQAPAAGPFAEQIREFQMLVAPRGKPWTVPPEYADRIHLIALPPELELCSSSAVRAAIAQGRPWEHLVPPPVAAIIRRRSLYSNT
jgi:nicotinic acid mononucleotide adenylyltransferase